MFPPPSTITLCLNSPHLELNHAPGVQLARFNTIVYFILVSSAQVWNRDKKICIFCLLLRCIISSVTKTNQRFASRAKGSARHRLGFCLLIISLPSINSLDHHVMLCIRLATLTFKGSMLVHITSINRLSSVVCFCFTVHRLNVELSRYQAKYRPVSYEVKVKSYRTGPGCSKRV